MKKIILLTALFIYYATLSNAQHAGDLDSSFGTNGIVTANLGSSYNYNFSVEKVLTQSDGSIYLIVNHTFIIKTHPNGSTDSSYGHNGFSIAGNIYATDALMQPDGKIVLVGTAEDNFALIRFNINGSPDKTFGENGRQITYFGSTPSTTASSLAYAAVLQDDGKIVAVGRFYNVSWTDVTIFAAIARYNTDGSLDNTFSEDGKNIYPDIDGHGYYGFLHSVALQHDGKIVVVGSHDDFYTILQRININGSSDTTFSEDGFQEIDFETTEPAMAIQSDDKIVLGSNALVRYNTDGSPDSTFNNTGKQTTDFQISSLSIQSDGKILAAGSALARYNADGSLDNSFSDDGKQANDFEISSLALQHDGKIVVAGSSAVRYNINGELDNSFVINGQLLHPVNTGNTEYNGVKFERSGKFLVTGLRWNGNSFENILVRHNTNGSLDSTFSEDGIQVVNSDIKSVGIQNNGILLLAGDSILSLNSDGSRNNTFNGNGILYPDFRVSSMAIQNDGKIVVAGTSVIDYNHYPVSAIVVARYNTDGSLDNSFSEDGKLTTTIDTDYGSRASLVDIQDDGKIVVAGYASNGEEALGVIVRYNTDGNLDTTFYGGGVRGIGFTDIRSMAVDNNGDIAITGMYIYRSDVQHLLYSVGTNKFTKDLSAFPFENSLAFQNDGKLIMGGSLLVRFTSNGNLDSSFNGNGLQTPEGNLNGVAVFDNKLYTVGSGQYPGTQGVVARYLLDGDTQTSPIVKITSPVDGASYTALATILLSADASDVDGTIKTVDFYNGNTLIFTETWPPFYRRWYNVPAGDYIITAKATDNNGKSTTSAPVHITVLGPDFLTANITSPGNGASFTAPATITITADVKGPNEIVKTDFYSGSTLIFSEHLFPYSNKWRNVPAGNYSITAKATDSKGNVATSVPVTITVKSSAVASSVSNKPVSLNSKTNLSDAVSVHLMPNPANNILNIRTTGLQSDKQLIVSVISASGVIMQTKQFSSSTQTIQLNVSSLVSGVYTIKLVSRDKVLYKQFVKL